MALVDRFVSSLATGGGTGTEADPWTFAEGTSSGNAAPGDLVNIKGDGDYPAQVVWTANGTTAAPIHYRAYTATPGDGGTARVTQNNEITADHLVVEGLEYVYSGGAGICVKLDGNHNTLRNTKITISGASCQKGLLIDNGAVAENCEIDASASTHADPWAVDLTSGAIIGCKVTLPTNGKGNGIVSTAANFVVAANNSIVGYGNKNGVYVHGQGGFIVYGNSAYNVVKGVDSVAVHSTTAVTQQIIGNTFYNGTYGVWNDTTLATAGIAIAYNAIGGMSTARYAGIGDTPTFYDTVLTADPFVDAANGDLSLNNAPGGGALARRAGVRVPALL